MLCKGILGKAISIHALREEGDEDGRVEEAVLTISIHALREEGDTAPVWRGSKVIRFLSTPSARRATLRLSFWGGYCIISIHALREEGD